MNVSPRTYGYLLRISISFFMSILMSFAMLVLNLGFVENFMALWFKSFSVAFALAVVISSLVFPLVIALLSKLVKVCDEPIELQEVTEGC
ncbi:DUF2798 domain-containing protein [Pseudovibrio ascidiaceicola]|uniref:DUF2798 domain-containing protein n=1 Tax=Pseudovibrio ascidiaceicola TaxID=285279 RepID=UPI003D35AE94